MENNNDQSGAQVPQGGTPVINQPTPQGQPVAGAPVVNNGGGASVPKGVIIGIVVGGVALIAVILGIIFIPSLFTPDYEDANTKIQAFQDAYNEIGDYEKSCDRVVSEYRYSDLSDEKYKDYVTKCLEDFTELDNTYKALEGSSGVKNDEEIKKLFEEMKANYEATVPSLKKMITLYADTRTLMNTMTDYSTEIESLTDEQIDEITKSIVESENETLKSRGQSLRDALKKYVNASKTRDEMREKYFDDIIDYDTYSEANDAYYDAQDELSEISEEFDDAIEEEVVGDAGEAASDLEASIWDLRYKIEEKYNESK